MKNSLDINKALLAFDIITHQGDKTADGYNLSGLTATSDFDGYTLTIRDALSELTIFFHNKYELEGPDQKARDRLVKNIEHLAKQA